MIRASQPQERIVPDVERDSCIISWEATAAYAFVPLHFYLRREAATKILEALEEAVRQGEASVLARN
jgi:uncharacterized protein (DUF1499 family)